MVVEQEVELLTKFQVSELQLIECCPFREGKNLIALGTSEKLLIVYFSSNSSNNSESPFSIVPIQEFSLESSCSCIKWGPQTRFTGQVDDTFISLVFGTVAGSVHVMETDGYPVTVKAHLDAINDIAISFKKNTTDASGVLQDRLIATVSEDLSLKVLLGDQELGRMYFKSPPMKVQWHRQMSLETVLVAESRGVISLVDWKNRTYLKSLYACSPGFVPNGAVSDFYGNNILLDCHWHHLDPYRVGAVIGDRWFTWDFHLRDEICNPDTTPNRPVEEGSLEGYRGGAFRWGHRHFAVSNFNKTVFIYNLSYSNVGRALRCGKDATGISWLGDFSADYDAGETLLVVSHPNGISVYRV